MSARAVPGRGDVDAAALRLRGLVRRTPVVELASPGRDVKLLLKLENRQRARCFKPRGALNAALAARERGPISGLVTFSSGNHGQAVALAAAMIGVRAVVVAPMDVRAGKLEAMRARGASVLLHGLTSAERMARASELADADGLLLVPPYDHPDVIAGQGTIGQEFLAQVRGSFVAVVPVGGGGLSAGLCLALAARPDVSVVGVEPSDADDARRSLAAGRLLSNEAPSISACDGLRNTQVGDLNFAILRERLAGIVTVSDDEVAAAVEAIETAGFGPVEPSGAAATAAVLSGKVGRSGETLVAIVSGGNA